MKKELIDFVKEEFSGNNEVKFFISERGNNRIEIIDLDSKEVWQTLEGIEPEEDNFKSISEAMISSLIQQSEM